jgi:cyclic-di-AMP phosphodiesterase PgpH
MDPDKDILDRSPGAVRPRLRRAFGLRSSSGIVIVALSFWLVASMLVIAGRGNSGYHLKQYVTQPVHARSDFAYRDRAKFTTAQQRASELEPRIYRANPAFSWTQLEDQLKQLPEVVAGHTPAELPESIRSCFEPPALALLAQYAAPERRGLYQQRVEAFTDRFRRLVVIPADQREQENFRQNQWRSPSGFAIRTVEGEAAPSGPQPLGRVQAAPVTPALMAEITTAAAECFREDIAPQIGEFAKRSIRETHRLDEGATREAQELAAKMVPARDGEIQYKAGAVIKLPGEIDERDLGILQAEHRAYRDSLESSSVIRDYLGIAGFIAVMTSVLTWYVHRYQPRIIRNHARALAMGLLLLAMMLLSQLAGPGTRPLYIFGIAPTMLTAIVLAIAYEPRFALGVSMILSVLTTLSLGQDLSLLIVLLAGCCGTCAFTGTVRTRGRLIEIGLASAVFMVATRMFTGVWAQHGVQPFPYILDDSIYAGIAGISSGFVVLGILPFVEKAFRITTGMTLLELSDASNPLQRKLAAEAPGTYSHSLQVATLAEAAAEAIGANSMLTRVGALYHDIGKTKRSHYFCENQVPGENAHLTLSPEVSLKIIVEHIKDGIELARQHNLPTALFPFIQQHHGTTVVEYFYHEACKAQGTRPDQAVSESSFRYPGPRPRTREIAIVMLADCCESAARAIEDPTPEAIEKMVHGITIKRLVDGQLSDCDLTIHELGVVEKTLAKTLQSIHHSRIAYPGALPGTTQTAATGS